jgi:tryptophan synthase
MTAGYPTLEDSVSILLAMQQGGTDVIELGIPFSDPVADGPVIQKANLV